MIYTDKLVYLLGWIFIQQGLAQAAIYACNATAPCGCSTNDVNINARIVGGEVAAAHSLGWSVSLRVSQTRHFCGGSILSPHYILTAAHCLEDLTSSYGRITVAVGSDRLNDNEGQRLAVSKIYLHPRWNTVTKENDIALIKLSKAINIRNPNSARLCLPPMGALNGTEFPVNQLSMVAIGWGSTQSGGSVTNELRQVTLFAVDKAASKCRNIVYNTDVQFCAAVEGGGKGKPCQVFFQPLRITVFRRYLPGRLGWSSDVLLGRAWPMDDSRYHILRSWLWPEQLRWCLHTSDRVLRLDQIHRWPRRHAHGWREQCRDESSTHGTVTRLTLDFDAQIKTSIGR